MQRREEASWRHHHPGRLTGISGRRPPQDAREVGYKRTVGEYNGPEAGRAADKAQALAAAARRYVPTETLTRRKPPEDMSVLEPSLLVDLSESLVASQSDPGPYWQWAVSRKRVHMVLVDLCLNTGSSEEELK